MPERFQLDTAFPPINSFPSSPLNSFLFLSSFFLNQCQNNHLTSSHIRHQPTPSPIPLARIVTQRIRNRIHTTSISIHTNHHVSITNAPSPRPRCRRWHWLLSLQRGRQRQGSRGQVWEYGHTFHFYIKLTHYNYWHSSFIGDADRVAAKIKGKLPGDSPNAEKEFKKYGEEAGAKLDKAVRSPLPQTSSSNPTWTNKLTHSS